MQTELGVQQISMNTAGLQLQNQQSKISMLHPSDRPGARRTEKATRGMEDVPPTSSPSHKTSVDSSQELNRVQLEEALKLLNDSASVIDARYSFQVNSDTNQLYVQIRDRHGEVIRQVPPEAILNTASKISRIIGTFLNAIA